MPLALANCSQRVGSLGLGTGLERGSKVEGSGNLASAPTSLGVAGNLKRSLMRSCILSRVSDITYASRSVLFLLKVSMHLWT